MHDISFHIPNDDHSDFYAMAFCECAYQSRQTPMPATLVCYFSPSTGFSKYSFQCWSRDGESLMYQRGPDYSDSPEAALLELWVKEGVPPFVWHLFPREQCVGFRDAGHDTLYVAARKEFCSALYGLRVTAWMSRSMHLAPLIQPPQGGFVPIDAMAATEENAEFLQAAKA